MLQLREPAIRRVCRHQSAECPLIDRTGVGVSLENARGDKRFQQKPTPDVDTTKDSENAMKNGG